MLMVSTRKSPVFNIHSVTVQDEGRLYSNILYKHSRRNYSILYRWCTLRDVCAEHLEQVARVTCVVQTHSQQI
jgi:hypothetical protein